MTSTSSNGIYLRSSINAHIEPQAVASTLVAFSPDIIPLGEVKTTPSKVVATYNQFVAHEVDPNDRATMIYVRGKAIYKNETPNPLVTVVTVKAVPNELILWPQAWEDVDPIGTVTLEAKSDGEVAAATNPLSFNPTSELGRHDAFIASAHTPNRPDPTNIVVPRQVKNWRDLVTRIGEDRSLSMYNVVFADPVAKQVSLTTRLRIFEDTEPNVELTFSIEGVAIPPNVEVSFSGFGAAPGQNPASFGLLRRTLEQGPHPLMQRASVPAGFDGTVTMSIHNKDPKERFSDYSSISLAVYAERMLDDDGDETKELVLLGAEHVVFDSNTRVKNILKKNGVYNPTGKAVVPGPDPPQAPFFFRSKLGDDGKIPRTGQPCYSPDIQPWGPIVASNIDGDIGPAHWDNDQSTKAGRGLTSNESNYIYVRGNATTASTSGKIILWALPSTTLIHPNQWNNTSYAVMDIDLNTHLPVQAVRSYKLTSSDKPGNFIVDPMHPFNLVDPAPPPAGNDHYCMVAECKPDGKDPDGHDYQWPHNEAGAYNSAAEFTAWVLSTPYVAWRNVAYSTKADVGDYTLTYRTGFKISERWSKTDNFTFDVLAYNCPMGSSITVDSTDPLVHNAEMIVDRVDAPMTASSTLTNRPGGYNAAVTVHWSSKGKAPNPDQKIDASLVHMVNSLSLLAVHAPVLRGERRAISNSTEHTVHGHYPNLLPSLQAEESPLKHKLVLGALRARRVGEKYSLFGDEEEWEGFRVGSDWFQITPPA